MGRRSINTTKSGKFMNPTDQARKEARKRELKKNKKQRMAVRHAVLKGKDPLKLLEDMEIIDKMEYDPTMPPKLNEKVLRDKRKKLKETFERVFSLYEKEDPEYASELRKSETSYEKKRSAMQALFDQVKMAEQVQLDQIPLPDGPSMQPLPSQIPLPAEFNELGLLSKPIHGILKRGHSGSTMPPGPPPGPPPGAPRHRRKAPGPPPGAPPDLSESEDEGTEMFEQESVRSLAAARDDDDRDDKEPAVKSRRIRFEDDASYDPDAPEKDSRPKFKPAVSALQVKMLQMAGQEVPMVEIEKKRESAQKKREQEAMRKLEELQAQTKASATNRSLPAPPGTDDLELPLMGGDGDLAEEEEDMDREDVDDGEDDEMERKKEAPKQAASIMPPGPPPGLPPGLPPGPPPGLPPMMFRPPPLRTSIPGNLPQGLPPGPPPGRPPGMPPGPPPGLPPSVRPRLPPGPPGMPPPRMMHTAAPHGGQNPNVLSAPPSIIKPPTKKGMRGVSMVGLGVGPGGEEEESKKTGMTIEAKPQIKNFLGEVTRFMPTALRVKRLGKDGKNKQTKTTLGKDETLASVKLAHKAPGQTKDDAYDAFMREMEGFL